jgi:hypothetical protein
MCESAKSTESEIEWPNQSELPRVSALSGRRRDSAIVSLPRLVIIHHIDASVLLLHFDSWLHPHNFRISFCLVCVRKLQW